jgi:hypothetical protein
MAKSEAVSGSQESCMSVLSSSVQFIEQLLLHISR